MLHRERVRRWGTGVLAVTGLSVLLGVVRGHPDAPHTDDVIEAILLGDRSPGEQERMLRYLASYPHTQAGRWAEQELMGGDVPCTLELPGERSEAAVMVFDDEPIVIIAEPLVITAAPPAGGRPGRGASAEAVGAEQAMAPGPTAELTASKPIASGSSVLDRAPAPAPRRPAPTSPRRGAAATIASTSGAQAQSAEAQGAEAQGARAQGAEAQAQSAEAQGAEAQGARAQGADAAPAAGAISAAPSGGSSPEGAEGAEERPAEVSIGAIDVWSGPGQDEIAALFRDRRREIEGCWEVSRASGAEPGRVELEWNVYGGRVGAITTLSNLTGDPELARCLEGRIKRWSFPEEVRGQITAPLTVR